MDQPQFKNRRFLLITGGLLGLLIAGISLLLMAAAVLGTRMASAHDPQLQQAHPLYGVIVIAAAAIFFGWTGVGSILAKRWARALMLIVSWFWLAVGILMVGFLWFQKDALEQSIVQGAGGASSSGGSAIFLFMVGITAVFAVLVPAIFILLYSGRNVRLTCEEMNPSPSWTDKAPLPILGAALMFFFSAVSTVIGQLSYTAVFPAFGTLITGSPGLICHLLIAAVWVYCGIGFLQLRSSAWVTAMVVLVIFTISSYITFQQIAPETLYTAMGMTAEQLAAIQKYAGFQSSLMKQSYLYSLPWFLYLLWTKRYFTRSV